MFLLVVLLRVLWLPMWFSQNNLIIILSMHITIPASKKLFIGRTLSKYGVIYTNKFLDADLVLHASLVRYLVKSSVYNYDQNFSC